MALHLLRCGLFQTVDVARAVPSTTLVVLDMRVDHCTYFPACNSPEKVVSLQYGAAML